MTYPRFLVVLRKLNRVWGLVHGRILRCGRHCPVTLVAKAAGAEVSNAGDYRSAARYLHLRPATVSKIIGASDDYREHDRRTRDDLLRVCGISEQNAKA